MNQQAAKDWHPSLKQALESAGVAKGVTRAEILDEGVEYEMDNASILAIASSEGRKDDSEKNRLELLPPELLTAVGEILTFGAGKYSARNWERGMSWGRVYGALLRHLTAWWGGEDLDLETGKSHLWHAGCCVAFLIAYEVRGIGTDDRPGGEIATGGGE